TRMESSDYSRQNRATSAGIVVGGPAMGKRRVSVQSGRLPKSLEREPSPHLFSELRILKGLRGLLFVTAHSKEVTDGQLRPKPGKTRCLLGTAHSKGLSRVNSRQFTVNSSRRVRESPHAAAPDAGDEGRESKTFMGPRLS